MKRLLCLTVFSFLLATLPTQAISYHYDFLTRNFNPSQFSATIEVYDWAANRGYATLNDGIKDIIVNHFGSIYNLDSRDSQYNMQFGHNPLFTINDETITFPNFNFIAIGYPDGSARGGFYFGEAIWMSDYLIQYESPYTGNVNYVHQAYGRWDMRETLPPVPEPTTIALLGTGMALLICVAKTRKRPESTNTF